MTRESRKFRPPAGAVAIAGALGLAVFFHGPQIVLLAGAQMLIVLWLALSLLRRQEGLRAPADAITVTLTCFLAWLALSLSWSPVPALSMMTFWWVGALGLSYWACTVSPERERVWQWASGFAFLGAVALCGMALVQLIVYKQPPRASFINIHSFAAMLVLIALPATARWLAELRTGRRLPVAALGAGLFLLFFTIATTQGRGTTVSLFLGMGVLAVLTYRQVARTHLAGVAGLAIGAYLCADLLTRGAVGTRISTLADPAIAALPRMLIWKGSFQMALDHWWLGTGLGTYYLIWPRYRDPTDASLGFFAHNDYLHLWIEGGLAAPLVLLALYVAVLVGLIRFRKRAPDPLPSIESAGLFGGLLAIAAHSMLDFNLYVLPISILAGLVLARYRALIGMNPHAVHGAVSSGLFRRPAVFRLAVGVAALLALAYLAALGTSDYFYGRGLALARSGDFAAAGESYAWAGRLNGRDDRVMLAHAELYRHVVARTPADAPERPVLYRAALSLLDDAQSANPLRATVHALRARLYHENPSLSGPSWRTAAMQEYQRALALDPRLFKTRHAYARLLLDAGDRSAGRRVLEDGIHHWYVPNPALVPLYETTARLRREAGDAKGAAEMEDRVRDLSARLARLAPVRPAAPDREPRMAATMP